MLSTTLVDANGIVLGEHYKGSSLTEDGISIETQLHASPNVEQTFPALIAQVGTLAIKSESSTLATREDVKSVTLELNESGVPYVSIVFYENAHQALAEHVSSHPDGQLAIYLDETLAVHRPNSAKIPEDEFKIISDSGDSRAMSLAAANRALLLKHGPLPCKLNPRLIKPR